jgi:DNA-binding transcriptional LysR family regulator
MMDRLDAMSVLLAAVDTGSLSAASRKLGTPLATVSRKVSELEQHLNAQLLIRSNRRLTLTDAGRSYVASSRRILDEVREAERAAAGEYNTPRGDLVISAPIVFGRLHLLPVVTAFLAAYPEINIQLVLADRIVHLLDDHVDLALRVGPLQDSSLIATRIGATRRVVCASPAYFAARGKPTTPDQLAEHCCIDVDSVMAQKGWTFNMGNGNERSVIVRSRLVVNTSEAAIDAAIAGLGITRVLCYQIASARSAGQLDVALAEHEPQPCPISLVYAAQGQLPLKLRAFLDFAAPRLKARTG